MGVPEGGAAVSGTAVSDVEQSLHSIATSPEGATIAAIGIPVGAFAEPGTREVQGNQQPSLSGGGDTLEKLLPPHAVRSDESVEQRKANFIASQPWDRRLKLWWRKTKCAHFCEWLHERYCEWLLKRPCWCYPPCLCCYFMLFLVAALWMFVLVPTSDPCGGHTEPGVALQRFAMRQTLPTNPVIACHGCTRKFEVTDRSLSGVRSSQAPATTAGGSNPLSPPSLPP